LGDLSLASNNDQVSCKELVEIITGYLEGSLPVVERARFEAHLETCQGCRTYLEQMRQTIAVLGELKEETLDPQSRDDLLRLFSSWRER
jgi:anti-sigma factor RsiW